jgi:predicted transposase/invertase (TIGR01784 family)
LIESNYGLGRLEGKEEGREEGRNNANRENARKMKGLGVDVKLIMQVTGLTLAEIDSL